MASLIKKKQKTNQTSTEANKAFLYTEKMLFLKLSPKWQEQKGTTS